ncbi:uncharacterized protein G2W53_028486 [Senna tora]|uniref:Uncharacterized protein n=1 Tax=Senna tora TaxID=362788 RepID=A0A834T628_9FABA|nr:uncharacterized protein G2W53_028486 [Senna tora]
MWSVAESGGDEGQESTRQYDEVDIRSSIGC